jgi:hypothetical protein
MRGVNVNMSRGLLPHQQLSARKWRGPRVVFMVSAAYTLERFSGVRHLKR